MITENVFDYLKSQWDIYFNQNSIFIGSYYIKGIPTEIYKVFLEFLINEFKQDIEFDFLYMKYEEYVKKFDIGKPIQYLNKKSFEKHLLELNLKTYVVLDENYQERKFVYFKKDKHTF